MELPEQADHFILRRRVVSEFLHRTLPDFLDRAIAVHQPDDEVRDGIEPVHAPRNPVLHDVPAFTPVLMPVDANVTAQPRPQFGDAVPGRTQQFFSHGLIQPDYQRSSASVQRRAPEEICAIPSSPALLPEGEGRIGPRPSGEGGA
jgi:hypothetical protein